MTAPSDHTPGEDMSSSPQPPASIRHRPVGWRDPRLIAGVLIVAFSILGGAVLFAQGDRSTVVWAVRRDIASGATLTKADLESRRVGLGDTELARYLAVVGDGPVGRPVRRPIGAGELLPAAALATEGDEGGTLVPLMVAVTDLPASVYVGSLVDVWVTDREAGQPVQVADRVFEQVRVVDIGANADSLAPSPARSVIVVIPGSPGERALGQFIGRTAGGRVILTQLQEGPLR